jgi:uncharacterized RDD family membrane protein YckC
MTATPPSVSWEAPASSEGPAPGVEFAPHGGRLVAYIFDGIIVTVVVTVLLLIGIGVAAAGATYDGNKLTSIEPLGVFALTITIILSIVIAVLYFPFFWARGGQTLGMKPFNLRVVRDRDGGSIGWGTAFLRLVGLWVAGAVFYIGFIWIFIDKRRRGWQDLIAGTVVIKQP